MRWKSYRSSGSRDISVGDSAWHANYSKTLSTISDGTGLISRVSLLLHLMFFSLLSSNWLIRSSRGSLQHLEIDRLEFTLSYLTSKSLKRSFSSENFELMPFLKLLRLRISSMSSSFDKFSNWLLIPIIVDNNK